MWVEKPVGRNLADTSDGRRLPCAPPGSARRSGFNYRNAPAVDLARRVRDRRGGSEGCETVGVRLFSDYAAHPDGALSWRFDPAYAGSGVIGDLASHGLDLARHVVGAAAGDISELVADQATFITERPEPAAGAVSHYATAAGGRTGPVGNEDHVSALLRFAGGARGVLESSRVAVGEQCTYGIEVHGDRGALAWDFRRMGELRLAADEGYTDASWRTVVVAPGAGDLAAFQPGAGIAMGYDDLKVVEAERLVRSIAEDRPLGATVEDALVAATAADAMVRSAQRAPMGPAVTSALGCGSA